MAAQEKFKLNHDLLEAQQEEFTKGGVLLRNVFSISAKHPVLSVIFALSFGVLTNAMYDVAAYLALGIEVTVRGIFIRLMLVGLFSLIDTWMIVRLRTLHKDLFADTPLSSKKLLVTLFSNSRHDYKDTPAYNTYESLIYGAAGYSVPNALEKVVVVVTEAPEMIAAANAFKAHIEASGREAELYGIAIEGKSLLAIQQEIDLLADKLIHRDYKAHEIASDYTGGTKDMSIALLRASEKRLITTLYLNNATQKNHSKYH